MILETKRLVIVEAVEADIEWIIAQESDEENRKFVWIGTREEHRAEIADPAHLLLVFREKDDREKDDGEKVGYALVHLDFKSERFELRRIVIALKNRGYGRESIEALMKYAFETLKFNRFWLDVYPDNAVGIALYESLGLHREGVLRQNYKSERGYLDQIIYSMLREEYARRALERAVPPSR